MAHQCTDHVEEEVSTVWRSGKDALIPAEGALFPGRCVICNRPSGWYRQLTRIRNVPATTRRSLLWALVLPSGFAIATLAAAKNSELHWTLPLPLCLKHRHRAAQGTALRLAGWAIVPIWFAMMVTTQQPSFISLFLPLALAPLIAYAGYLWARVAHVTRVEDDWLHLRVGRRFVESLPPVPAAHAAYRKPADPSTAQQSVAL